MAGPARVKWGHERDRLTVLGQTPLTEVQKAIVEEYLTRYPHPIRALIHAQKSTYRRAVMAGLSDDDINQMCCLGVIRGARTWNPKKSLFDTYCVWKMWGEVSRLCDNLARGHRTPTGTVGPLLDNMPESPPDEPLDASEVGRYLSVVTDRQRQALDLRYGLTSGHTMKLKEVGVIMGISHERVRQLLNLGIENIRTRAL